MKLNKEDRIQMRIVFQILRNYQKINRLYEKAIAVPEEHSPIRSTGKC